MKRIFLLFVALFCISSSYGQYTLSGSVADKETGDPLIGSTIQIPGENIITISGDDGNFEIEDLASGKYSLRVSFVGFETFNEIISIDSHLKLEILLVPVTILTDEVVVSATRVMEHSPMTFTNVKKEDLAKQNFGQDIPILLDQLPAVVTTSDAGTGIGYTGIRIRGSDATRINVTLNGIPLNDPESQGVFWVNLPDFTSSVDNIQVQRGVGTSTNGAGAFGATLNLKTTGFRKDPYTEISNSIGSFNSRKHTISAGTGTLYDHFVVDARLSKIYSDGYVDRAFSDLTSYYLSGAYYGNSTMLKFITFSGKERTYQAWWGVPESRINNDEEGMQEYILNNGLDEEEATNLLSSGRTYNYYTYDEETDNYQQDHYQIFFAQDISENLTFNASFFKVHGEGFFEQYRKDDAFSDYGLDDVIIGGDSISSTDLIRRRWLDNDFVGSNISFDYNSSNKIQLIAGGGWSGYSGKHFGEIIWARIAGNTSIREQFYNNLGEKEDVNVFAKATFSLKDNLHLFGDLQYRNVSYKIRGKDIDQQNIMVDANLGFFNPKFGITYDLAHRKSIYTSLSVGNREPVRDDFLDAPAGRTPQHETLYDIEAGYKNLSDKLSVEVVGYFMNYKNQLVLTGELNDVGANIRTNVDISYRAGIELQFAGRFARKFSYSINGAFSRNKIKTFEEVLYDYGPNWDEYNIIRNKFTNTDISFSPNIVAGSTLSYFPVTNLELTWLSKFVGKQYLDNTTNNFRAISPYFKNDLRIIYSIRPGFMKEISISLLVNNIFNELYESNGYTYGYFGGGQEFRENLYYAQAGTNFMTSLVLKF